MTSPASAELMDVFDLTGHGTVMVVGKLEGTVHIGDALVLDDFEARVEGIEMINVKSLPADTIGLLIKSAGADVCRAFLGRRATFRKGA